jgi:hypothetical protein
LGGVSLPHLHHDGAMEEIVHVPVWFLAAAEMPSQASL